MGNTEARNWSKMVKNWSSEVAKSGLILKISQNKIGHKMERKIQHNIS